MGYTLQNFGVDVTRYESTMSPEQFAEHITLVMRGLVYLERVIPPKITELETGGGAVAQAMTAIAPPPALVGLRQAKQFVTNAAFLTTNIIGSDWRTLTTAGNTREITARLRKLAPKTAQSWYQVVTTTLNRGYVAMDSALDVQLTLVQADLKFWENMIAALNAPTRVMVAITESVGGAVASVGGSLLSTVLSAVKPLLIPLAVGVGGYILFRVARRRGSI